MSDLPYIYAAVVALVVGLALIVIHSRWSAGFRLAALTLAGGAFVLGYAGLSDLLSRPKPVAWELMRGDLEDYEVLYADMRPGAAIYLLLRLPDMAEPRLYVLPWHANIALQLERTLADAESRQVLMRADNQLFESDIEDRERIFYATPVAAFPDKDQQRFEPVRFVPDESNTMYGAGEPDG